MPEARIFSHRFHYRLVDDCAVVRPEGACNEDRTQALARLVNSPLIDSKNLILDLSHTDYVESPGFRWIVRQVKQFESSGRTLVITGIPPSVDRAFKLLRLDRIVSVTKDVSEAISMIHGKKAVVMA